jgi:hypothetical protein
VRPWLGCRGNHFDVCRDEFASREIIVLKQAVPERWHSLVGSFDRLIWSRTISDPRACSFATEISFPRHYDDRRPTNHQFTNNPNKALS